MHTDQSVNLTGPLMVDRLYTLHTDQSLNLTGFLLVDRLHTLHATCQLRDKDGKYVHHVNLEEAWTKMELNDSRRLKPEIVTVGGAHKSAF